eukprot:8331257-Pyramimonas_sp.AAC.1
MGIIVLCLEEWRVNSWRVPVNSWRVPVNSWCVPVNSTCRGRKLRSALEKNSALQLAVPPDSPPQIAQYNPVGGFR